MLKIRYGALPDAGLGLRGSKSELGVAGFIYLLFVSLFIVREFILHLKSILFNYERHLSDEKVCILIAVSLTVFPFLPTLNFFNNWINIIYYFPIGIYLYLSNREKYDSS